MGFVADIKKLIVKHGVKRYIDYAEQDAEVVALIADKQMELLQAENLRLENENTRLKMEGLLPNDTIELCVSGQNRTLSKEEVWDLVTLYKTKELRDAKPKSIEENTFIPQDIIAITTGKYDIARFHCHYEDAFGQKRSLIVTNAADKYTLFFDLFGLTLTDFNLDLDRFRLSNAQGEQLIVSTSTTLTCAFLTNFAKGKAYIQHEALR